MKLIVGLGNVGKKYENTRHNIGFKAIDFVAQRLGVKLDRHNFNGQFYKGRGFILSKPHTFMNLSGDFVYDICRFYKIKEKDILVIHDDMDLEVGKLRHRESGSSGGHNGINDIMVKFDTNKINRLRIGIGRPVFETVDYVLSNFKPEEWHSIALKVDEIIRFVFKFLGVNPLS